MSAYLLKHRAWLVYLLTFLEGMTPLLTDAREPSGEASGYYIASSPMERPRPISERIQKQRQDKKWMLPVLSAEYCAHQKAIQLLSHYKKYLQSHHKTIVALNTEEQIKRYQNEFRTIKQELEPFGNPLSCQSKTIRRLYHCLPSVRDMQLKGLGVPYGEPWCFKEPYLTYEELETGIESPIRHRFEKLDMHEVAFLIKQELAKKEIQAQVVGRVTANTQRLTVTLPAGMGGQAETIIQLILAEYGERLRRAGYRDLIVDAENLPPESAKHRLIP